MIKTVSFAPPRASGSRSSAKASGAKTLPVEALRPPGARNASGRTPKSSAPTEQTSLELLFEAPEEEKAPVAEISAPKIEKKAPKTEIVAPVETEMIGTQSEVAAPKAKAGAPSDVRAKRARVPKDFAAQYGEKTGVKVVAPPVEAEIARKRLSKVEREARRELIKPSEGLLERLARVNQIAARKPKSEPRGKGWKFVCGRCGTTSFFETAGGLCACGTIAVKE